MFKNLGHNRFAEERDAYRALGDQKGIVKYLGCFRKRRRLGRMSRIDEPPQYEVEKTDNILLEWAEMDLVKYFKRNDPPFLAQEILDFWHLIFELAEAVRSIHSIKTDNGSFRGIHADIKPANILIVQEKIKLADLGYAKFKREKDEREAEFSEPGGTKSYAAPEQFQGKKVDTKIDIWALGIVLSIAATWVAKGQSGISDFREVRLAAHRKLSEGENSDSRDPPDAFFNKGGVLPVVTEWHEVIRGALRRYDTITSEVLDVVDRYMLRAKPQERLDAAGLCEKLAEVYNIGERKLKTQQYSSPSPLILDALQHANEKAKPPEESSVPTLARPVERLDPRHADMDKPVRPTAARPGIQRPENTEVGAEATVDTLYSAQVKSTKTTRVDRGLPYNGSPSRYQSSVPLERPRSPLSPQSPQSPQSQRVPQSPLGPQSPNRPNIPQQTYAAAHADLSRQSLFSRDSLLGKKKKKDPNLREFLTAEIL